MRNLLVIGTLIAAFLPALTLAQPGLDPIAEANRAIAAHDWPAAKSILEHTIKTDEKNPRLWYMLGTVQQSLGEREFALNSFQHAAELAPNGPRIAFIYYAQAGVYAEMKKADEALTWLKKALDAHYPQPRMIRSDPHFASLKNTPGFLELVEGAEQQAKVCMRTPEYRGFDFWVGEWEVFNPTGQQVGTSSVVLLADGCIVDENWQSANGSVGKSFNFYNPTTKKWHQSYMDADGANWMMDGELKDDVLRYEGYIYSPTGRVPVHMTFTKVAADKVRQTAETSADEGKTWTPVWNGLYIRKSVNGSQSTGSDK